VCYPCVVVATGVMLKPLWSEVDAEFKSRGAHLSSSSVGPLFVFLSLFFPLALSLLSLSSFQFMEPSGVGGLEHFRIHALDLPLPVIKCRTCSQIKYSSGSNCLVPSLYHFSLAHINIWTFFSNTSRTLTSNL
jgi:hypothetical protein